MKREIFQTQSMYPKGMMTAQSNYVISQPEISFHFREQKSPFPNNHQNRPNPVPFHIQPPERFSHDLPQNNQAQSNNAFVHLRNEISNLRSEFSKLIQKDNTKVLERTIVQSREKQKKDASSNKRDNRVPTYSTIGFYNKVSQAQKKQKQSQVKPKYQSNSRSVVQQTFEHKSFIFGENANFSGKLDEKNKFLAKSYLEHTESQIPSPQTTKIQDLQREIIRINEIRHKAEQELAISQSDLRSKQAQFSRQLRQKVGEIQSLKQLAEQDKISLSLKNSLVEKLQREITRIQTQNNYLHGQIQFHSEQLKKQKQKYENQLSVTQEINRINIAEIINKYQQAQEQLQRAKHQNSKLNQTLLEKDLKLSQSQQNHFQLLDKVSFFQNQVQKMKKLKQESFQRQFELKNKVAQLEHSCRSQQPKNQLQSAQVASKLKLSEQENADLKKRVESYKKSVEQLNITNNSSREKLAKAKQQVKALNEENKIKQVLINSLYRDISILDNQMRQIPALKAVITINNKFVEDLNYNIVLLQCQRLSNKYKIQQQTLVRRIN